MTEAAFRAAQCSGGTEGRIIDALRSAAVLTLSLVAVADGEAIGRAAFSAVRVEEGAQDWFGLGPVAVRTDPQRRGLGQALIGGGLQRLAATNAGGCVVLGDPAYYGRFGFKPAAIHDLHCRWPGTETAFQLYPLAENALHDAHGEVTFPAAFNRF